MEDIYVFTFMKLFLKKPLSSPVQNVLLKFGLTFLVGLMILVIAFDLGF